MNFDKKKIYQYKIDNYKQNYKLTGDIKLLEKIYKYIKKINLEGGGRFKSLSLEQKKTKIINLKSIFVNIKTTRDNLILFGRYLALTIKKNIIDDESLLLELGAVITDIATTILNSLDADDGTTKASASVLTQDKLIKLFQLLNDKQQIVDTELENFVNDLEAEIKDILLNIDDDKNVEKVILPAIGIELGLLLTRRMPTRLVDPCILIGKSVLPAETPLEIQRQFGMLIMGESDFLNSVVNDQIAESLPPQRICDFGFRLFRFFTETFDQRFKLELKDNMLDTAFGTFGSHAIDFLRCFSPQVEVYLQINSIGSQFFNVIKEIFTSLEPFKKSKTKIVIPNLQSIKLEVFNVNDDVAKTPLLVCSRLIQKLDTNPELGGTIPQTFVFLDCSGSQRSSGDIFDNETHPVLVFVKTLLQKTDVLFHKFGGIPVDTPRGYPVCFTDKRVPVTENGWKKISSAGLTSESLFSYSATDTVMVKNGLESLPQNVPINLIFQCDGDFSMYSRPIDLILTECVDKLQNIKRVTLVFSPWIVTRDKDNFIKNIKLIFNSIASSIVFETILLPRPKMASQSVLYPSLTSDEKSSYVREISGITEQIYTTGIKPCRLLPPEFYSFGSFMIHKELTPHSIINLLNLPLSEKNNFINEMVNLLIKTIADNPGLLNIEGSIYEILHLVTKLIKDQTFTPNENTLKHVIQFAEGDGTFQIQKTYLSVIRQIATFSRSAEILKLATESKICRQEVNYTEFISTRQGKGNFYFRYCREVNDINLDRIKVALEQSANLDDIFKLFDILIPELLFVPKTEEKPIFPPRTFSRPLFISCPNDDSSPELIHLCLSSFFVPFGGNLLNNFCCTQLAMYAYSSEKVIANVHFMKLCVEFCIKLLENNDDSFLKIIGYDVSNPDDFSKIDNIWYIFHNSQLLYRFLLLIPLYFKPRYKLLTEYFENICGLMNIHLLGKKNLSCSKVIHRPQVQRISAGSIVHVSDNTWGVSDINMSWCPWKSLPAIVKVLEGSDYYNPARRWCTFLDSGYCRWFNEDILQDILASPGVPQEKITEISRFLNTEKAKDGPARELPVSRGGIPRNVGLHQTRLDTIKRIIGQQGSIIGQQRPIIDIEISIPKETLIELLNIHPHLKNLLREESLSKELIMTCVQDKEMVKAIREVSQFRESVCRTIQFRIGSQEYQLNEDEITSFLRKFHSSFIPLEEWSGSQIKINMCCCCLFLITSIGEIDAVKLECGHLLCKNCFQGNFLPDYKRGDFLRPIEHRCPHPECLKFINPSLFPQLIGKWWSPLLIRMEQSEQCVTGDYGRQGRPRKWRFCSSQNPLCQAQPLFDSKEDMEGACAANDAMLPTLCPTHSITDAIRPCPSCHMIIQRTNGCDLMTCCYLGSDRCYANPHCDHIQHFNGTVTARGCGTIYCFWCLQSFGDGRMGKVQENRRALYRHIDECPCRRRNRIRKPHEPPEPVSSAHAAVFGIAPSIYPPEGNGGAAVAPYDNLDDLD